MLPKTIKKRPWIDENASSERFRRQIAPRSAPGRSGSTLLLDCWSTFWPEMSLPGSFLGPVENRKSVQNRICEHRRALWPSKNGVWEWARKSIKIEWKIYAKFEGFWWLRTTFGVIPYAYFTLLRFSKKIEKSMPKGRLKVILFDPKCDLGRSRVDLSDVF